MELTPIFIVFIVVVLVVVVTTPCGFFVVFSVVDY